MTRWMIAGETDPLDGDPLYWSNADGWVSRETADVYDSQDGNLPIGGRWTAAPCGACGHAAHWRACRAAGNGRLVDGCYCRRRGPQSDGPRTTLAGEDA